MSEYEYDQIYIDQKGKCAICGSKDTGRKSDKYFQIDHDHSCCKGGKSCGKCIRGLLCANCNNGLGRFRDNIELLKNAIAYLEKWASL